MDDARAWLRTERLSLEVGTWVDQAKRFVPTATAEVETLAPFLTTLAVVVGMGTIYITLIQHLSSVMAIVVWKRYTLIAAGWQ